MKKLELNLLSFILIEALYLLCFFKIPLINLILGNILGLLLIYFYNKIKFKNNLFLKILLLIILIILLIFMFNKTISFISFNILKEYPLFTISLVLLSLILILTIKGYHSFIKTLELSSYFLFFFKILSFFLIIFNIQKNNINLKLLDELKINYSFIYLSLFILLTYIIINYIGKYDFNKKTYLFSFINNFSTKTISLLVMGSTLTYLYSYPYISVFKRIKYLDFIERMEGLFAIQYLFSFFFLNTFLLLVIKKLIIDIFKIKKDKIINIILSLITIFLLLFESSASITLTS